MISENLKNIVVEKGEKLIVSGNTPFFLDDKESAWLIIKGKIDVFRVNKVNNKVNGARHHFVSFDENNLMLGFNSDSLGIGLSFLAVGAVNTEIIKISLDEIKNLSLCDEHKNDFVNIIDNWIDKLSEGVTRPAFPKPRADILISNSNSIFLPIPGKIKTHKEIYWITESKLNGLFAGMEEIEFSSNSNPFPLSPQAWLETLNEADFQFKTTKVVLEENKIWQGLDSFYDVLIYCEFLNGSMIKADELGRMNLKAELQKRKEKEALSELSKIIDNYEIRSDELISESDPIYKTMCIIAEKMNVPVINPDNETKRISKENPIKLIAEASGLRARNVNLDGDWWKHDSGHLFAFKKDKSPIALIRKGKKYLAVDVKNNSEFVIDEENNSTIETSAFMLYKGFDDKRKISLKDIFSFGIKDVNKDLVMIFLIASLASLLGLLVPIFTGIIYDKLIPGQEKLNLGFFVIILITTSFVIIVFKISQSIVNIRVQAKLDYQLEAAVWDRVLKLPVKFFSKFNSGDLAKRVKGIQQIRETVTSISLSSLFDITFSIFNFTLLFFYSSSLALWSIIPMVLSTVVIFSLGYNQLKLRRNIQVLEQYIQGFLLQIINGISKLRASATETSAFSEWAKKFTLLRKYEFKSRLLTNYQEIFFSGFPIFTSILFFYVVIINIDSQNLSTGEFIAFNTAFSSFLIGIISVSQKVIQLINLEAIYVNAKPILEQLPEDTEGKPKAKELSGMIELKHISFKYGEDSPLVLKDLSLTINAGEFVAVVGASGSGKSTLLRLLMGFEKPEQGSIFYDSFDLSRIDVRSIRKQVGVVLQNGKLLSGTILQNIIGSSNLTIENAWDAAKSAGMDQDISEMPMGMNTVVSENGSTLSGGQRQRLMIARAIVRKPKIIMMDEATSALDNRTQEIVSQNMERLQATRIVIAHRLSTIINADRIIVLKNGEIEQIGTYNELLNKKGFFRNLAFRQIA